MEKNCLTLDKISAYTKSFDFSNEVWNMVIKWDYFSKDTVGKQIGRATDSISANIAEGFGRYSKKDKIRFYRISLGSLEESVDWIRKSSMRELFTSSESEIMLQKISLLKIEIVHLIHYTNNKLKFSNLAI
jgi:four helix bundle protein